VEVQNIPAVDTYALDCLYGHGTDRVFHSKSRRSIRGIWHPLWDWIHERRHLDMGYLDDGRPNPLVLGHRISTSLSCAQLAERRGPPLLKLDLLLESAVQQRLDSLLRFRPRQRGLKGGEGVEELVGRWQ
jgi:hypothetical protein